jgi:hypothetical protein
MNRRFFFLGGKRGEEDIRERERERERERTYTTVPDPKK